MRYTKLKPMSLAKLFKLRENVNAMEKQTARCPGGLAVDKLQVADIGSEHRTTYGLSDNPRPCHKEAHEASLQEQGIRAAGTEEPHWRYFPSWPL